MDLLLTLFIVYIFLSFFIIGILLSKVKVKVNHLEYKTNLKETERNFEIKLGIYLYGKIKIIGVILENDGIIIFGKKITYNDLSKMKWYEATLKKVKLKEIEKDFNFGEIKEWKLQLEKLDLKIEAGFENVLITSFVIFAISTILSIFVKKTVKKYDSNKYKYLILPHYRDSNIIKIRASGIISAKTVHIISILLKYRKRRLKKYERTSYRRSYENSYE